MSKWRIMFDREFKHHDDADEIERLVAQMFIGAQNIEVWKFAQSRIEDTILHLISERHSLITALPYDELYAQTCALEASIVSRRDFQHALDSLRDRVIVMEQDPADRRRTLIYRAAVQNSPL